MKRSLVVLSFAVTSSFVYADQGGLVSNSGGSLAAISIANPPGTLSITPPNLAFTSTDGSTIIQATFATNNTVEFCSGGGKGGKVTCSFTFTGNFSGTLTVNGASQAINGTTSQVYGSSGILYGGTGYNSAYTPFYFTDGNARILRSDDLSGTNAVAYGTQGSDVGQFYGPSGIALDSAGRIYVADTYNDRIVRIDDMNGTNWTSFGTYGSGTGQFAVPQSVTIDPAGHIWVLDNGNGRLVRMDDMNGTNWTVVGAAGSGVGQFGALSSAPGFDSLGRIYVADAGNRRIVRFDDLNFTNWTTLSQSQPVGPYIYLFGSPSGVVVDPAGKIYVADGSNIIRVDDMTGANWTSIGLGANTSAHTIAIDSSGMVLIGNGYNAQIVDSELSVLTSNINGLVQGVYVSVYGAVPVPLPNPRPSAISFTPNTLTFSQNVGTTSLAQTITISNFGGSPLGGLSVSAAGGFSQTSNCPTMLTGGANCTVNVTFTPAAGGTVTGALNITDNSGNMGSAQVVSLSGTGTVPGATTTPTSLSFQSQVVGTTSTARTITLQSTGTGPLQVSSIAVTGPFSETNTCTTGPIASGASCTVQVTFTPTATGSTTGVLTITDNAGTQTVSLTGNGSAPVSLSSTSLNFGSLAVGGTSTARTVTVTNRLTTSLTFTSIATTGPFAIGTNTCGAGIAANSSCTVGVTFTPAALGAATGTLTFTDSANTSPQIVSLSGNGTAPVTLSTTSLSFNTTVVGATSSARTVTLTNQQTVALSMTSVAASAGFAVASDTCGASVGAGANCTIGVTFSPAAVGSATGTLTITDSAANSPQTVNLSGTGSAPVTFSASSLNFGTVKVGMTSSAKTVTITNRQSVALSLSGVAASAGFTVSSNTCGSSIAAGSNCTVAATFAPTVAGAATGTLTFTDSAATSPQSIGLSGTGQ